MHKPLRTLVSAAVLSSLSAGVYAGGFSLYTESSPMMTGNFAAGAAAEAADASIGWYNPAGLVLIPTQQAVIGGVGVFPKANMSGTSTFTTTGFPAYTEHFSNLDGAESAFVPSLHYALPLGDKLAFGLSMVSPFGLSTNWGPDSAVRYQASFTELLTFNVAPELGVRLSENFSVGAGLDLQYARVKFNRIVGAPSVLNAVMEPPSGADSLSYNKGDSYGVGFHVGGMAMFNDNHTRIGINYQSQMSHKFYGYSELTGPLANNEIFPLTPSVFRSDNLYSSPIDLPAVVTLSGYQDVNEKLALLGSVVFTGWSSFQTIQLNNVAAPGITPTLDILHVLLNSSSAQNYRDTWRASVGANYHVNDQFMLRAGGGYDQTPTNDVDRDMRLPDANRWALSIGAHYDVKPSLAFDLGYTHLFPAGTPTVNRTDVLSAASRYNVTATGTASADLVGAQVVWLMDSPAPMPTK